MEKLRFQLPTAEDDLWEQVVLALLAQRNVHDREACDHLRVLEQLGFEKIFCSKTLTLTFTLKTATWLAEEMKLAGPGDKAREWLKELKDWQLLVPHGTGSDAIYEFPIPGLDEYFAARHLEARWAEEDKRYQDWLPCFAGRLMRSKKLECPNPHCHVALPQFRKLLRQSEYEETLLLMVGLLKEAKREEVFLYVIRGNIINWLLIKTNLPISLSFLLAFALAVVAGVDLHGRGSGLLLALLLVPIWWCAFGLLFFLPVGLTYKLLERTLFNGLRSHLNLKLQALSRCRHAHRDFAQAVMKAVISSFIHYNSLDLYNAII